MPVSSASSCLRLELKAELVELIGREVDRRAGHVVVADLVLRKRLRVADPLLPEESHQQAVDARRDTTVGRGSHRERVEQESKLLPLLLRLDAEIGKHLL